MSDFSKLKGLNPTQKEMYWRQLIAMEASASPEWMKRQADGVILRPSTAPGSVRAIVPIRTSYQDDYPRRKITDAARSKTAGMCSFQSQRSELTINNRRFATFQMLQELEKGNPRLRSNTPMYGRTRHPIARTKKEESSS